MSSSHLVKRVELLRFKAVNEAASSAVIVLLKDVEAKDFEAIMQFIYCGFVNVDENDLEG